MLTNKPLGNDAYLATGLPPAKDNIGLQTATTPVLRDVGSMGVGRFAVDSNGILKYWYGDITATDTMLHGHVTYIAN
jgi:hypothetical protein